METILFLHGWGGNEHSFAPIEKYFGRYFQTLCPAMPCPPDEVWTLDDYVMSVEKLLAENNVTKCHIICHSFGARVAVLLINKNPHLVGKLIVTGGAGLKPRFNLRIWAKIKIYKIKKRLFGRAKGGSADYRKLTPNGKKTFNNIVGRDLCNEIKKVKTPTLLIYGAKDRATPVYMAKRWAKLCGAKLCKADGHGANGVVANEYGVVGDNANGGGVNSGKVKLCGAELCNADGHGVNVGGAKLCGVTCEYKIYKNCGHFAYLEDTGRFIADAEKFLLNS
ncbi:MAG: alpha/beta hydrolase [Christensenellaceae bacterium]|jgi:pimeloyl-ACP methyl ester carboxylesterase|nr:alpha/beta hydrolase [Christensenellaceae bacterium]